MKNLALKILFIFSLVLIFHSIPISQAQHGDISSLFDDRVSYDVFFSNGGGETNVARSVEIVRFEVIAGKTFIVVRSSGFNFKNREGFILFESVSAILPDHKIKVGHPKGTKYR